MEEIEGFGCLQKRNFLQKFQEEIGEYDLNINSTTTPTSTTLSGTVCDYL